MGLLIGFGRGFRAEFRWWIVVESMWWAMGCGGTVGLGLSLVGLLGGSGGLACVVDGGSVGDSVVDDGSVGGDWKFWVDQWVEILMVG